MDKIQKALSKLSEKEQRAVRRILEHLLRHDTHGFDVKKLKGRNDIFRIRKGSIRILYRVQDHKIFVLSIERRSDTTYRT